jgi:excisionase family DNA binding protein
MTQRIFIRVCEIPEAYGISKDTVYRAINAQRLTRHKWGRASLIRCADLECMITNAANQQESNGGQDGGHSKSQPVLA